MVAYLVLFFICAIYIYCFPRWSFVKNTGLHKNSLHLLISLKIFVAIGFALFLLYFGTPSDYSVANNLGIEKYQRIFSDPAGFFTDFGQHNYTTTGDFLSAEKSAWDDFSINIIIKILAIFNFITRGSFLLNSVLFSGFGFLGSVGIYRFLSRKNVKNIAALICSFLLPSTILFTAGIHKDSLVFLGLGLFLFAMKQIANYSVNWKSITLLLVSFFLILVIRNYVALLLLPFALAYLITGRSTIKPVRVYGILLVAGSLLFFAWVLLLPSYNPVTVIAKRQHEFLKLNLAASQIKIDTVQDLQSFANALPRAGLNVFTKPFPGEFPNIFFSLFGIEMVFYLFTIFMGIIFYFRSGKKKLTSTALFCLFFSITILMIIGLITPNAGTIFRYRALYLPLLLYPFVKQFIYYIKYKNI